MKLLFAQYGLNNGVKRHLDVLKIAKAIIIVNME